MVSHGHGVIHKKSEVREVRGVDLYVNPVLQPKLKST